MVTHSVEGHLGLVAVDYDREIRRLVPHYDELLAEGVELLRALVAPNARILDLGGGTGALSSSILAGLPGATVVLLDVDPKMLERARTRLAPAGARVSFVEGSFHDSLPRCDAIMASLSLHHVHDLAAKTNVYRAIHAALPAGAPFLNLDATVSADAELSKLTFRRWADVMAAQDIDEASARKHFDDWSHEDRSFPLRDELDALARAGFPHPECFWRKGPVAIYGGRSGAK
jgi:SAM-dependent methyltransferase